MVVMEEGEALAMVPPAKNLPSILVLLCPESFQDLLLYLFPTDAERYLPYLFKFTLSFIYIDTYDISTHYLLLVLPQKT